MTPHPSRHATCERAAQKRRAQDRVRKPSPSRGEGTGALVFGFAGNISLGSVGQTRGEITVKWLVILLLPVALAGCAVGHLTLPMTLGPSETPKASCLTYADAPAFGDCKGPGAVSISQETK